MSYRIKNTALDHTKRFLHRKASKMQMEPVLAGRRLRIRTSMVISDELFAHNKANLELWRGWGVVDWEKVGEEKTPLVDVNTDKTPPKDPSGELPVLTPQDVTPPPLPLEPEAPVVADKKESPPAETTQPETKPQPKGPFNKGKKQ